MARGASKDEYPSRIAQNGGKLCGLPKDFWIFIETGELKCPNCHKLQKRKCLTCGEIFMPKGCKVMFTCPGCFLLNAEKHDYTYGVPD